MLILPFTIVDIEQLTALQPETWPDIKESYHYYMANDFCFPFKIVLDDVIAAVGSLIKHNDVAWLGHIIVHPQYRKKGLGETMTRHLVDASKQKGCTTVYLIATDLGEGVYLKVGFVTETEYPVYTGVSMGADIVLGGGATEAYCEVFENQLAAMDQLCSGEDRFFHLKPYLTDAIIHHTNGVLQGYYIPRLGSGLLAAINLQAAKALLAIHTQTPKPLVFPNNNTMMLQLMQEQGRQPVKFVKRMRLGKQRATALQYLYNRIGGNLG